MRSDGSRPLHLIYGVNTDDDAVELDTLERLANELGSLTWDYCVADQASSAVHKGFVTGLIEPEHLYGGDVAVYLCGPPPMVEAVRKHLEDAGVEPVGFYYERFALSGTGAAAARVEVPAEPEVPAAEPNTGRGCPASGPRPEAVEAATVLTGPDGRAVAGQISVAPQGDSRHSSVWPSRLRPAMRPQWLRTIAGQPVARAGSDVPVIPLDPDGDLIESGDARSVAGQQVLARTDIAPLVEPKYMIGEEHPSVLSSDAVFDAREALELGALELTIGRMTSRQLVGYRLLAESTMPVCGG